MDYPFGLIPQSLTLTLSAGIRDVALSQISLDLSNLPDCPPADTQKKPPV